MRWGTSPGAELANYTFDSPEDDPGYDAIRATGFSETRSALSWILADPDGSASRGHGDFDWSQMDSVVTGGARHGLHWTPFLCYPPRDLSADPHTGCGGPPKAGSEPALRRFVAAFADRYGPGGTFWTEHPDLPALPVLSLEVWNEPNLVGAWPSSTNQAPEEYAHWYEVVRDAVHARPAGRDMKLIYAGLSPVEDADARTGEYGWSDFLRRSVAALAGGPVDEFGFHPYVNTVDPEDPAASEMALIRRVRQTLTDAGRPTTPLALTEFGLPTSFDYLPANDPHVNTVYTEAQRAAWFRAVIPELAGSDCAIASASQLFFSSEVDVPTLPAPSDALGMSRHIPTIYSIARPDSTLRPSGEAVKDALARVAREHIVPGTYHVCGP